MSTQQFNPNQPPQQDPNLATSVQLRIIRSSRVEVAHYRELLQAINEKAKRLNEFSSKENANRAMMALGMAKLSGAILERFLNRFDQPGYQANPSPYEEFRSVVAEIEKEYMERLASQQQTKSKLDLI